MKGCWIILFIIFLLIQTVTSADLENVSSWTKEEIISVVETHFQQIQNVEYSFTGQQWPVAEPDYRDNFDIIILWLPLEGWEKRSQRIITTQNPDTVNQSEEAWNGEHYTGLFASSYAGSPALQQGRKSSKREDYPPPYDPLLTLRIRRSRLTLADILKGEDVKIEGVEVIEDRETVAISVNVNPIFSREEGRVDRYWLDMERGGLPLRVETYYENEFVGMVSDVQISELQPGVFFPTACTVTFPGRDHSPDRWSEGGFKVFQIDAASIKLNQELTKEDFVVDFEHGTLVWDADIQMAYHHGVGLYGEEFTDKIMLNELAEEAKDAFEADRTDASVKEPEDKSSDIEASSIHIDQAEISEGSRENTVLPIIAAIVLVLGVLLGVYLIKKNQGHN